MSMTPRLILSDKKKHNENIFIIWRSHKTFKTASNSKLILIWNKTMLAYDLSVIWHLCNTISTSEYLSFFNLHNHIHKNMIMQIETTTETTRQRFNRKIERKKKELLKSSKLTPCLIWRCQGITGNVTYYKL